MEILNNNITSTTTIQQQAALNKFLGVKLNSPCVTFHFAFIKLFFKTSVLDCKVWSLDPQQH